MTMIMGVLKLNGSEKCEFSYSVFYTDETQMYGIACSDEEGRIVDSIGDISREQVAVDDFCCMLNSAEIHPCHFYDVYEDYFG